MPNQTQPILCCVGADVAGEPTQFLMERAVAASHLDWHVITVEVPAEQLAKAWEGIHVMRFQAARFFAPYQSAAMPLVGTPTAQQLFIGGVTSAMRVGDEWTMWHNSGEALVQLLSARVQWDSTICWVQGNTMRTRSFLMACHAQMPRRIVWTDAELTAPAEASTDDPLNGLPLEIVTKEASVSPVQTIATSIDEHSATAVVCIGEFDMSTLEHLLAMQPNSECGLLVVTGAPGYRRKLSDAWRAGQVTVISPADLIVAEEAYDQARWTGQLANTELLREAYEEYADF